MHRRPMPAGPIRVAALLLLACQPTGAAAEQFPTPSPSSLPLSSGGSIALSSAQTERGLAYLDKPLAEASWSWWNEAGWSVGASAAKTFHGPQAALAANLGYSWQLADAVDAYFALSHSDYRRQGGWRYRYDQARFTVNLHDRLFLSVGSLFNVRSRTAYGAMPVAGTVAKELVWRQMLPAGLTLTAGAGHAAQHGPSRFSYWYGNVGLRAVLGRATLEGNWITTDSGARRYWGSQAGQRWVASVRWDL